MGTHRGAGGRQGFLEASSTEPQRVMAEEERHSKQRGQQKQRQGDMEPSVARWTELSREGYVKAEGGRDS